MDVNEYTLGCMVHAKLSEAREASYRRRLLDTSRRHAWRDRVGTTLIALGEPVLSARGATTPPTGLARRPWSQGGWAARARARTALARSASHG